MNPIKTYIIKCKKFFIYAGVFSFVINLMTLMPAFYMLELYDRVLSSHSNETLAMLTLLVVCMLIVQYYVEYLRQSLFLRTSATMQKMMQTSVLACMLSINNQSRTNRRGLDDVHTVQSFFSGSGVQAIFEMPWIPVYLFVLYLFHPWLCLMAVVGAVTLMGLTLLEENVSSKHQKKGNDALRQSQDTLDSALNNLEVINAMNMQASVTRKWSKMHEMALHYSSDAASKSASIFAWSRLVRNLLTTLALAVAAYLAINDKTVTPGVMIAATIIMGKVMVPIDRIISSWNFFTKARQSYARLNVMLANYNPDASSITLRDVEGNIKVEKLFFAITRDRDVLRNINFSLSAGEALGVIGNSAAGKSTLTKLLVGLYKPTNGVVRMDGADVHQWAQTGTLGPHIGYLPQAVELFSGTVAENIARLLDPADRVEEVINAAKIVGAHEFILKLPQGYDTEIGEGGRNLSSGQRQMVGLARALFGNPKLIVLDEPNANLDGPSELAFMRMIRELQARKITIVIVSHRPSVLRDVDKLLVLDQGRQVSFGNREEVMQNVAPSESANATQVALVKGAQPV